MTTRTVYSVQYWDETYGWCYGSCTRSLRSAQLDLWQAKASFPDKTFRIALAEIIRVGEGAR